MSSAPAHAPKPSLPKAFSPPAFFESVLANGLRVIVAPRRGIPIIGAQLTIMHGGATDPQNAAGLSSITASLMGYGSQALPSEHFSEAMDAIGASFSSSAGYDAMYLSVVAMTHLFPKALPIAAEAIFDPALGEDDFERIQTRALSELRLSLSSAGSLARLVAGRVLYGAHAYGMPLAGTLESHARLTLAQVRALARARIRPGGAAFIIVGDLSVEEGQAFAESVFGRWSPSEALEPLDKPVPLDPSRLRDGRHVLVDLNDSGRSAVVLGFPGLARQHPRYLEATLANGLLSGYSGRLNREIRVKRGLSYGASASIGARRAGGSWAASTLVDHQRVGETITVMQDVIRSLTDEPPSLEDLAIRKAALRGSFGRGLETVGGVASVFGSHAVYDLPLADIATYLDRLEAITPDDVVTVARELLVGTPHIVVVGEAATVREQMASDKLEVFNATELDLQNTSLKRQEL